MTNAAIIEAHAFKLMQNGIIKGSGNFGYIENEDGSREQVELPEAIHTFQYWKSAGRSVKKGEKAVDSFCIWKHTTKMLDENTGNEENDKMNALINAKGGQKDMFMQKASFFAFDQTEPTADREKRTAEKKAAKAEKKAKWEAAKQEEAPKAEAEPEKAEQPEPAPAEPEITDCAEVEPEAVEAVIPHYYEINEKAAATAKRMMSYDDYKAGSATAEYRASVDAAAAELEEVKKKCKTAEQREHAEFLFDRYCKALAQYINRDNEIGTRCPSILITGGSNFPVKKKEKQTAAWEKNQENYNKAEHYLSKMRGVCYQSVKSDDPEVIEFLRAKLEKLEANHEAMKKLNAEARKNGTEPLPWYALPYNLNAIKRTRARLEELEAVKASEDITEETELYKYEENAADMRIRFYFDGKPEPETIKVMKENGFRWAPSVKAWQRQLTGNGKRAAANVKKLLEAV